MQKFLLLLITFFSLQILNAATVTGTMVYKFNDYQGYKPDIGSEIHFVKLNKLNKSLIKDMNNFESSKIRYIISLYEKTDNSIFKEESTRIAKYLLNNLKDKPSTIVDGSGNFKKKLSSGRYMVIVKSRNRNFIGTVLEYRGLQCFYQINLKNNIDLNIITKVNYCEIKE